MAYLTKKSRNMEVAPLVTALKKIEDLKFDLIGERRGIIEVAVYKKDGTELFTSQVKMKDYQVLSEAVVIDSTTSGADYAWDSGTKALTIKTDEYVSFEIEVNGNYDNNGAPALICSILRPVGGQAVLFNAHGEGHFVARDDEWTY
jgi:hypothetical protein